MPLGSTGPPPLDDDQPDRPDRADSKHFKIVPMHYFGISMAKESALEEKNWSHQHHRRLYKELVWSEKFAGVSSPDGC